ncbi:MAG: T9SS type A sorting domain-containing protein [Candidatus Cloacimonetes bacterium]|nr:T9SS type A sorting domain-containing protein [Candidatus Cloacimonadota bacterium]
MKRMIVLLFLVLFTGSLFADWNPGDPAKWVQMPDPTGYDVNFTWPDSVLADDWLCTEPNYVDSVHIWVSFRGDYIPADPYDLIEYVHLSIHSDNPLGPHGYSEPLELLWQKDIYPPYFTVRWYDACEQGWYDPFHDPPLIIEGDHWQFYQINICAGPDAFYQTGTPAFPEIYWLDACVKIKDEYPGVEIGWKSSLDHWNDDAVYWDINLPGWAPLPGSGLHPPYEIQFDLAFVLQGHEVPCPVALSTFNIIYTDTPVIYWATEWEEDNRGWNIYRGENEDALMNNETISINSTLIPGAGTTQQITDYQFEDERPVTEGNTYWYWLESVDFSGMTEIHPPGCLSIPISGNTPPIPEFYGLYQNYPNPFNPSTTITFSLKAEDAEDAEIIIYNLKGQIINVFNDLETNSDELGSIIWDGKDKAGKEVSSGFYFYQLKTAQKNYMKKMLLIK